MCLNIPLWFLEYTLNQTLLCLYVSLSLLTVYYARHCAKPVINITSSNSRNSHILRWILYLFTDEKTENEVIKPDQSHTVEELGFKPKPSDSELVPYSVKYNFNKFTS